MKIAIVAPCPVPYTVGGAEKMWWGLQREINTNTSHQAEIIKLLTKEHSFWDLIDSYQAFARLDLSGFDLVISSKYPAWMVSHPRHICYMQHRLRGLYDHYHFTRLPERYETSQPEIVGLQRILDGTPRREGLDEVFDRLRGLRYHHEVSPEAFVFPSSLIRQIVHYFDSVSLSTDAIQAHFAISQTVAKRTSYFPAAVSPRVVYHPSNLESFRCDNFDYIFTASRIDGAKRIGLLVDAMKFVKAEIELRIAGDGPDRERLAAAAKIDPRIRFLGFTSDADLTGHYADALAVAFVPFEEDLGLITIEGMMSGKPVITTSDAGGPTEFVQDGETGLCVAPAPEQIGAAIDRLAKDRQQARQMGEAGRAFVCSITWKNTVNALLASDETAQRSPRSRRSGRPKLTVATTFPITPVRGGGQVRIYNFYKNLVPNFDVEIIALGNYQEPPSSAEIAPGVREIRIPRTPEHVAAETKISGEVDWFSITDVVFPKLAHLTPRYAEALARSSRDADVVVASHPYAIDVIAEVTQAPLWYEAHNVEYVLKRGVIPSTNRGLELLDEVRRVERRCCESAALILAASSEDSQQLEELYGTKPDRIRIVPNGTDAARIHFIPRSQAEESKNRVGLRDEFLAVFLGSWHPPNLEAIEAIIGLAEQHPDVQFLILGSSCDAFRDRATPANVGMFGSVDDATKSLVISAADLALNPMRNGSGTNLKMLEYAATGLPILSTRTGIRGLGFKPDDEVFIAPLEEFSAGIERVRQTPRAVLQDMTIRARRRTEIQFDWRNIGRRFLASI